MAGIAPTPNLSKLIVVIAFDRDDEGVLQTAFGPQDYQSEDRAARMAKGLAPKHAGVIAWSREAIVDIGAYGDPVTLFMAGDVPDVR